MAVGDADRQRRSRAHRAGDHTWCDPLRCRVAGGGADVGPLTGSTLEATEAWTEALAVELGDPRRPLVEAALVLAIMVDRREGLPQSAVQLSGIITTLLAMGDRLTAGEEIVVRSHARRALALAARSKTVDDSA